MLRRGPLLVALLLVAAALVVAGVLLRRDDAPAPPAVAPIRVAAAPEEAPVREPPPSPSPSQREERESLADRRDLGTGESPEVLARLPTHIDYPLQEKYRDQVWSEVPYELIAAHDGVDASAGEGARRLFVAVVEPGLPDARVERLVRDLRARHRDAEVLRIRVFDSREAATTPSWTDGGAARDAHLLADLYRDSERERFRVRGREVEP